MPKNATPLDPGGHGSTVLDPGGLFGPGNILHGPKGGATGDINTSVPAFAANTLGAIGSPFKDAWNTGGPIGKVLAVAVSVLGGMAASGAGAGAAAGSGETAAGSATADAAGSAGAINAGAAAGGTSAAPETLGGTAGSDTLAGGAGPDMITETAPTPPEATAPTETGPTATPNPNIPEGAPTPPPAPQNIVPVTAGAGAPGTGEAAANLAPASGSGPLSGLGTLNTLKDISTVLATAGSITGAVRTGRSNPNPPPAPEVPPPITMPTMDSPITRIAQQNSIMEQIMRRGRASTILTNTGLGA